MYIHTQKRIISVERKRTQEFPPNIRALQQNNGITIKINREKWIRLTAYVKFLSCMPTLFKYFDNITSPDAMQASIHYFISPFFVCAGFPYLSVRFKYGKSIINPCVDHRTTTWLLWGGIILYIYILYIS